MHVLATTESRGNRRVRGSIQLDDGTRLTGLLPGHAKASSEEHKLRNELACQQGGIVEVSVGFRARVDVATDRAIFEVKARHLWLRAARQVAGYSALCGLPPALALFGPAQRSDMVKISAALAEGKLRGVPRAGPIGLWWWTGARWSHLNPGRAASDMPHGARFGSCAYCGEPVVWLGADPDGRACHDYDGRTTTGMHECEGLHHAAHTTPGPHKCLWCAASLALGPPAYTADR